MVVVRCDSHLLAKDSSTPVPFRNTTLSIVRVGNSAFLHPRDHGADRLHLFWIELGPYFFGKVYPRSIRCLFLCEDATIRIELPRDVADEIALSIVKPRTARHSLLVVRRRDLTPGRRYKPQVRAFPMWRIGRVRR